MNLPGAETPGYQADDTGLRPQNGLYQYSIKKQIKTSLFFNEYWYYMVPLQAAGYQTFLVHNKRLSGSVL
jgi:hypothetical protein